MTKIPPLRAALIMLMLAGCTAGGGASEPFVMDGVEYSTESVVRVEFFRERFGGYSSYPIRCGGVLVAEKVVLTAAHCVDGSWGAQRVYSDANLVDAVLFNGERSGVEAMFISPKHKRQAGKEANADVEDDWAVLRLKRPLGMGRFAEPLYLADDYENHALDGPFAQAGFSKDKYIKNLYYPCALVNIHRRNIESACKTQGGDSGGPMFAVVGGRLKVIGVLSGGEFYVLFSDEIRKIVESQRQL